MKTALMPLLLSLVLLAGAAHLAHAQVKPNLDGTLALSGYDAVAYRDQQKAVKGDARFTATHLGAVYRFASAAHRDRFVAQPEPYLPAYGGWCAYAIGAKNELVEVNPKTFKVIDGRTYLFYNAWGTNTLTQWSADEARLHRQADANWNARQARTP